MNDFYGAYFRAVRTSRAHAQFCERAYGKDLSQHGFMTMEQLDRLLFIAHIDAGSRVLDVGCGNGMIAEYIASETGAQVMGVDNSPEAIAHARARTRDRAGRLCFADGDLMRLALPGQAFDALLSIDTLYFSDDYVATLCNWQALLVPRGQMLIFFSYGVDPEHPVETFNSARLPPARTPLGEALRQLALTFNAYDFTKDDYLLAQRKVDVLESLRVEFVREGNLFLYENRIGEARGVMHAVEIGMHARYLYHVRPMGR